MNVILLTILLTMLGMCLVGYFIWLGVSLYKLMKFQKKAENSLKHIERWIDDNNNLINEKVDQIQEGLANSINYNNNSLNERVDEISDELNGKIDSKSDKLQNKLDALWKSVDRMRLVRPGNNPASDGQCDN